MSVIAITNGRIIDPTMGTDAVKNIYIQDDQIVAIGEAPSDLTIDETLDAEGCWVVPGFIDLNSKIPSASKIGSETAAAIAAGFTAVCMSPDAKPVIDSTETVNQIEDTTIEAGQCDVFPIAAMTQGLNGELLSNMATLKDAGCIAVSAGRVGAINSLIWRRCLEYAASQDLLVMVEPIDKALENNGVAHEGAISTAMGLAGIPETAETTVISQLILLAEQTGARIHFNSISCATSVALIDQAQDQGLLVSADVAIANLMFTDEYIQGFNSLFHLQPPLRSENDRQALLQGVEEGLLAISSNHTPRDEASKKAPFAVSAPGMATYDSFLTMSLQLIEREELSLDGWLTSLTDLPAEILGFELSIEEQQPANLIIIDPKIEEEDWEVYSVGENIAESGIQRGRVIFAQN